MLRPPSTSAVAKRVKSLLLDGKAALCEIVFLELWSGAKGKQERAALSEMQRVLKCYKTDSAVWSRSWQLAQQVRQEGLNCPAADLVIAACAMENGIEIEHCDKHLASLQNYYREPGFKYCTSI